MPVGSLSMTEPYPYPTNIHWYAGIAFHLDGRITYLTEKDLNPEPSLPVAGTPMPRTPGGNAAIYDYEVKSWPWFFEPMCAGKKKHDMRDKTERPYRVGDRMLLREFDPRGAGYTGREAIAMITYITSNDTPCAMSSNALDKDACILSVTVSELGDTDRWA